MFLSELSLHLPRTMSNRFSFIKRMITLSQESKRGALFTCCRLLTGRPANHAIHKICFKPVLSPPVFCHRSEESAVGILSREGFEENRKKSEWRSSGPRSEFPSRSVPVLGLVVAYAYWDGNREQKINEREFLLAAMVGNVERMQVSLEYKLEIIYFLPHGSFRGQNRLYLVKMGGVLL